MSKQLAFYVDAQLCIGCNTCSMACRNQYHQDDGVSWRRVYPLAEEIYPHRDRAFFSLACNHCEHPVCLAGCPVSAYTKRDDGIVVHDRDACIGCKQCVRSCPFGGPVFNSKTKKAEKCSLCHERVDDGRDPACVQGCPTGALQLVDLATFADDEALRFPPGFPEKKAVSPSTRFKMPAKPTLVRRAI